jgi:hypothetical protein
VDTKTPSESSESADSENGQEPSDDTTSTTSSDDASGYTGGISVDDKAGKIEAAMLATCALKRVAHYIVDEIIDIGIKKTVLYGGSYVPDFQALTTYQIQIKIIDEAIDKASSKLNEALIKIDEVLKELDGHHHSNLSKVAVISAAIDVGTKVLDYLRTDYSFKGIEVTADDLLLLNILAGVLTARGVKVMLPTIYRSGILLEESPIANELRRQATKKAELKQKIDAANQRLANFTTDEKNEIETISVELQTACANGEAVIKLYDNFIEKLTTPDEKAKFPLATIIQQRAVQDALKNGASLMSAKISFIGGTNYTARNLWNSLFGPIPFFIRSGVVVNYNLFDGNTGQVQCAGAVPFSGGFYRVNELPQELEGNRPPRSWQHPK